MALIVSSAWDHARVGTASLRFTDASGTYGPISISTGRHSHPSAATLTRLGPSGGTYSTGLGAGGFAVVLAALMDAATAQTVTVTRSSTTGLYALTCTGASFSLDFTTDGAAGTLMRQLLGMTGNRTGALTYTSQCVPRYTLIPRAPRSNYQGARVANDGVTQWKTDRGIVGSLGPTYLQRMTRWEHQFEPEGYVWHAFAATDTTASGQQYTWEALTEDAYQTSELAFVEDSVTPEESLGFQLTAPCIDESMRPVRPEMRRFTVTVDASILGRL